MNSPPFPAITRAFIKSLHKQKTHKSSAVKMQYNAMYGKLPLRTC